MMAFGYAFRVPAFLRGDDQIACGVAALGRATECGNDSQSSVGSGRAERNSSRNRSVLSRDAQRPGRDYRFPMARSGLVSTADSYATNGIKDGSRLLPAKVSWSSGAMTLARTNRVSASALCRAMMTDPSAACSSVQLRVGRGDTEDIIEIAARNARPQQVLL
jgi:hypothetical protein